MPHENASQDKGPEMVRIGGDGVVQTVPLQEVESAPVAQVDLDAPLYKVRFGRKGRENIPYTQRDLEEVSTRMAREMFEAEMATRLGESKSEGAAWLRQYQASHIDFVQELNFETEEEGVLDRRFIKQLSDADVVEIGVIMARSGYSVADMEDLEVQHVFNAAVLTVGTCKDALGRERYFKDDTEARIFYESAGPAGEMSAFLRMAIMELNPRIAKKRHLEKSSGRQA